MKKIVPIIISEIKNRKEELLKNKERNIIQLRNLTKDQREIEEELGHLQYFLYKNAGEPKPTKEWTTKEMVITILRKYGKLMRNGEIHNELQKNGKKIPKRFLNTHLHYWVKDQEVPIKRVENGVYVYKAV